MSGAFREILNMSVTGAMIILGLCALRLLLKKLPKRLFYAFWAIPAIRLVCPLSIPSAASLFNILHPENPSEYRLEYFHPAPAVSYHPVVTGTYQDGIAQAAETAASPPSVMEILSWAWLAVAVVIIIYNIANYFRVWSRVRDSEPAGEYFICKNISSPFVFGFIRPKIYLPDGISERDAECILAHEKAHIERHDNIVKLLTVPILAIHWFNPAVWLGIKLMTVDMELSCDERAISRLSDGSRADYATALLNMSVRQNGLQKTVLLGFGESSIKTRIKNALSPKKPTFWAGIAAVVIAAVLAITLLTNPVSKSSVSIPEKVSGLIGEDYVSYSAADIPDFGGDCLMPEPGTDEYFEFTENTLTNIIFDCEEQGDIKFCLVATGVRTGRDYKNGCLVSGMGVGFINSDGVMMMSGWEDIDSSGNILIEYDRAGEYLRSYMFDGGIPVCEIRYPSPDGMTYKTRFYSCDGNSLTAIAWDPSDDDPFPSGMAVIGADSEVDPEKGIVTDPATGNVYNFMPEYDGFGLKLPCFVKDGGEQPAAEDLSANDIITDANEKYNALNAAWAKENPETGIFESSYPDYYGGAYITADGLTVYLTENNDEVRAKIAEIIDLERVSFETVKYPMSRLIEEQNKIDERLRENSESAEPNDILSRITGTGIYPPENAVHLFMLRPSDWVDEEEYIAETMAAATDFDGVSGIVRGVIDLFGEADMPDGGYSDYELSELAVHYYNITQPEFNAFYAVVSHTGSPDMRKIEVHDYFGDYLKSYTVDRFTAKGTTELGREVELDFLSPQPPYNSIRLSALAVDWYFSHGGTDRAITVHEWPDEGRIDIVDVLNGDTCESYTVSSDTGLGEDSKGRPVDFTERAAMLDIGDILSHYTPEALCALAEEYYRSNVGGQDAEIASEIGERSPGTLIIIKDPKSGDELWRCIVSGITAAGYDGSGEPIEFDIPEEWEQNLPSSSILDLLMIRYMDWERFNDLNGMLANRDEPTFSNGYDYYPVTEPGFDDLKDIRVFLLDTFTEKTADRLYEEYVARPKRWVEIDGKLYTRELVVTKPESLSKKYRAEITESGRDHRAVCVLTRDMTDENGMTKQYKIELMLSLEKSGWKIADVISAG